MSQKESKSLTVDLEKSYYILRDNKTFYCRVVQGKYLHYSKKNNLKVGTYATFRGGDDPSSRTRGSIIMSGTKHECETSLPYVGKSIDTNEAESFEHGTAQLNILPLQTHEDQETIESNDIEKVTPNDIHSVVTVMKSSHEISRKKFRKTTPSTIISTDNLSQSETTSSTIISTDNLLTSATTSSGSAKIDADYAMHGFSSDNSNQSSCITQDRKSKPTGAAADYFIQVAKDLTEDHTTLTPDAKTKTLNYICAVLKMTETDLQSCTHQTNITKTCRQIIRFLYPDPIECTKLTVSGLNKEKLDAIQKYARLAHPTQYSTPNSILNSAMNNVFSLAKRKHEQCQTQAP